MPALWGWFLLHYNSYVAISGATPAWCDASSFHSLAKAPSSSRIKKERALFYHSTPLVPETGLEPAHQMAYAPKAYVYTNFTTRAYTSFRPALRERALNYILFIMFMPGISERAYVNYIIKITPGGVIFRILLPWPCE